MTKRILALILCFATVLSMLPPGGISAVDSETSTSKHVNYGAVIGNTAHFNLDYYVNFLVFSDPSVFGYDVDWNDESNWIYHDEVAESYGVPESHVFSSALILTVRNYYFDAENNALWYKVDAAPGYELPEAMQESCWVFINYTDVYQEEGWQEWAADSLIVDNSGRNFVFDKDGNPITSAEIGLYDTLNLTCRTTLAGSASYQWQILVGDEWAEIMGANTASLPVSYTLLANALDTGGSAQLRCVTRSGSKTATGEPVTVTVDTNFDYDNYVHPEEEKTPPESRSLIRSVGSGGVMPLAEGDSNVCYVTVQYLFANGTQAANPFVAEVPLNIAQSITANFPYVQGYLPHYEGVRQDSLTINKVFTGNEVYTVIYEPTEVSYTVDIYFQNVDNDNYSFYDSVQYEGLTGSKVPLNTGSYAGMRELLHETPTIAADGSTHVEVYYDRIYFMTRVYLMGGYGIYSVYARYGADLQSHLSAPTRPGYSFVGWDEYKVDSDDDDVPDTGGDGIADTVYATVPAKNLAYVALWKEDDTVQVNVVFWGQNPNDDEYSYLQTKELYVKPGLELTYSLAGGYVCGLQEHTHGTGCTVDCGFTGHTHNDSCYGNCTHTVHNELSCYTTQTPPKAEDQTGNAATAFTNLKNSESQPTEGYVYRYAYRPNYSNTTYYYNFFFVGKQWYYLGQNDATNRDVTLEGVLFRITKNPNRNSYVSQLATLKCNHTHTQSCLDCDLHVHVGTCYTCTEHTHTAATCGYPTFEDYSANLWTLSTKEGLQETITVERDGSSVLNVYFDRTIFDITFYDGGLVYTISEKWGSNISAHWPIKGTNGTTYSGGVRWDPDENCKTFTEVLVYIDIMPAESFSLSRSNSTNEKYTMHYMVEVLPGADYTHTYTYNRSTKYFVEYKVVEARYNYVTEKEDFIALQGFNKWISNPTFSNGQINKNSDTDVYFYYARTADNKLEFYSGNDVVKTEMLLYEQPLNTFADYTNPPPPSNVEEGSHEFKGWYFNPQCTRPADLTAMTMPTGNLALYAKWEPKFHEVRIVLQKNEDGVYGPEDSVIYEGDSKKESLSVLHGTIVFSGNDNKIPPTPDNGLYKFLGWFYEDDGVELMWDFEHHPVVSDTVIYAKWSSEVLVPYTIYYKDALGNDIAEPTIGSSLAGHSLTVKAKVGNELYAGYRQGYFPNVVSHSIELRTENALDGITYTFVYTKAATKQYTVHYLDADNGNAEMTAPIVRDSLYAMVTETFKSFADVTAYKDHVPDAYQKTLVLSANPDDNHLYFYYKKSVSSGVWYVEHVVQDKNDPTLYNAHSNNGGVGDTGTPIVPSWPVDLSTDGYVFKEAIINNGTTTETVTSWDQVKGAITKEGLSIQIKYDRIKYPYKVVYLNKDNGNTIHAPDVFTGAMYGSVAQAPTQLPNISGYVYASSTTCTIVKDGPSDITKNIIYVYYTEQSVRLDFKVVGPNGCGTVSPESTYVKVNSDTGASCTATPAKGYRFVGWYSDAACKNLCTANPMLILKKPDDGWAYTTYYAKFELGVAPLTIKRENAEAGQVYVYEIKRADDPAFVIYVTITGNGAAIIRDLPIASYTVTQQNGWSWRYDDSTQSVNHQNVDGTIITFGGSSKTNQWLNGNSQLEKNQRG